MEFMLESVAAQQRDRWWRIFGAGAHAGDMLAIA
jgi:hypothetical protein